MRPEQNVYLPSKPRYEILDGLRGVGALIVVAAHLFENFSKGPQFQIINHGYLAVDFFFLLSGFVIGYAYDDRWSKMTTWQFFKRRLVRLHPMVIMGGFIGLLLFYLGDCPSFWLISKTPWWKAVLIFLLGCTMIPAPARWDIRGWSETYPLNGPCWSLFFEYFANILYALVIRHMGKRLLTLLVILFAGLTISLSMNLDPFHLLENNGAPYTVIGGWSLTPDQLFIGLSRLLYPFFCGLLLSRMGKHISLNGGFWWSSLLVVIALAMPRVGGVNPSNFWMNGIYDSFCILILFPVIVSIGAGSQISGKRSIALCKFLGDISYPLYITHFAFMLVHKAWVENHADAALGTQIIVSVSLAIFAIMVAYAAMKLYDQPIREWLKQHVLMKKSK